MLRPRPLHVLAALIAVLASCQGPEPRPFAGRGGRPLDYPPRYGEQPTQYVDPNAPVPIDPNAAPVPAPNLDPAAAGVDPGMVVAPPGTAPTVPTAPGTAPTVPTAPGTTVPGGVPTPPSVPQQPVAPAPAPTDVPFARKVPGQPSQVYSLKDPKRIISVEGLRPGQKARDPVTGEIFRVPY
jgi:hypothetical protein